MSIDLNHTIVHACDKHESANFMAEILGLSPPESFGHFLVVKTHNGVSLDFVSTSEKFIIEHYAFLVGESEFDQIFERIKKRRLTYWADPGRKKPGEYNTHHGGRGLYFEEPSGHLLEIITRPYTKGK